MSFSKGLPVASELPELHASHEKTSRDKKRWASINASHEQILLYGI